MLQTCCYDVKFVEQVCKMTWLFCGNNYTFRTFFCNKMGICCVYMVLYLFFYMIVLKSCIISKLLCIMGKMLQMILHTHDIYVAVRANFLVLIERPRIVHLRRLDCGRVGWFLLFSSIKDV
jgi:hypothetical protein